MKSRTFYKKLPIFIKSYPPFIKNYRWPLEKKLKPLISHFIKNSIFGNNRDPCHRGKADKKNICVRILEGAKVVVRVSTYSIPQLIAVRLSIWCHCMDGLDVRDRINLRNKFVAAIGENKRCLSYSRITNHHNLE